MQADDEIPAGIMTTTEEHYYKSLELLDTISRQYFSAKLGELMLMKEFRKSRDSERITGDRTKTESYNDKYCPYVRI